MVTPRGVQPQMTASLGYFKGKGDPGKVFRCFTATLVRTHYSANVAWSPIFCNVYRVCILTVIDGMLVSQIARGLGSRKRKTTRELSPSYVALGFKLEASDANIDLSVICRPKSFCAACLGCQFPSDSVSESPSTRRGAFKSRLHSNSAGCTLGQSPRELVARCRPQGTGWRP